MLLSENTTINSEYPSNSDILFPHLQKSMVSLEAPKNPRWIHFASTLLSCYLPVIIIQRLLEQRLINSGIIMCTVRDDSFDTEYNFYKNSYILACNKRGVKEYQLLCSIALYR